MILSTNRYNRHVAINNNPENLNQITQSIDQLQKTDVTAFFPTLSISSDRLYYMATNEKILHSRTLLKSGYQSLLARLGIPFRLVDNANPWVEIPLVNESVLSLSQRSTQGDVLIRRIGHDIRAILSASYTAIDDKQIIKLLEDKYLSLISGISFTCTHTDSNTHIIPRQTFEFSYGQYGVSMFLYITNSEIGDASVKCGVGITITHRVENGRSIGIEMIRDIRSLGKVIHRGEAIKRLDKQIENLFTKSGESWSLLSNALTRLSSLDEIQRNSLEEKMIKSLQTMPEFNIWKEQYDELRKTARINNVFDLIYLMTSIPYRDEHFNSVVEEILYGRFF